MFGVLFANLFWKYLMMDGCIFFQNGENLVKAGSPELLSKFIIVHVSNFICIEV